MSYPVGTYRFVTPRQQILRRIFCWGGDILGLGIFFLLLYFFAMIGYGLGL